MKLQENTVFANRYELQRLLGRGGFSEVWLAKDQWTHLNVAIKVYAPGQGMEEDGMREFCGELAAVFDLGHPNLLEPKHVDTWENMPYLIMAYCPNGSCAKLIGKVTEEQMWKMIHDVASGLAYLHEKGLVHQDIKPANVMIDEDGHYLITDFGVSSRARSTLRKSVISSTGGGTTAYMGPERFSKQPAPTKASDIWSFGAMCFEMVEGYVPFGENGGVSQKIGADIPVINANVSDALKYAITMMLQKETWDRPTAAKLVEWSAAPQCIKVDGSAITGEPVIHHPVENSRPTVRKNNDNAVEPDARATVCQEPSANPVEEPTLPAKKKRKIWIAAGVMALVVVIVCIFVFGGNTEKSSEELAVIEDIDTMELAVIEDIDTVELAVVKDSVEIKHDRVGTSENIESTSKATQTKKDNTKDNLKKDVKEPVKKDDIKKETKYYDNGDKYVGEMRNGQRHGFGILTYANGEKYEGEFKDDKMNGRGTYTWANGNKYEGDWVNDARTGRGTHTWANGEKYEGDWVNGNMNGRGTRTWPNGEKYEGEYKDGKKDGKGTYTWTNGDKYEGDWVNDKMNGRGTYTWANGEKYKGTFENGKRTGNGTYYSSDGSVK